MDTPRNEPASSPRNEPASSPRVPGNDRVPVLLTVAQFAEKHPAWSEASLRYLILNADSRLNSRGERIHGNGFGPAILRIGGPRRPKVLIDEREFFAIIRSLQHRKVA